MSSFSNRRGVNDDYSQSEWYPQDLSSDTFSTDGGGSRERLDSGSFSNSSSDSLQQGKKKRRSHRPRGCRGGGARRQRKAMRAQAREREMMGALQENVKPDGYSSSYPPVLNTNSSQYSVSSNKPSNRTYNLDKQPSAMARDQQQPPAYSQGTVSSLQPCMSTLTMSSSTSSEKLFSIFKPQQSSNQYIDSQGRSRNRVPYGTMTFVDSQGNNRAFAKESNTFPRTEQPSYSYEQKASSHGICSVNTQQSTGQPLSRNANGGAVDVLPPLPIDPTAKEPEKFDGPNPYALSSNRLPSQSEPSPLGCTTAEESDGTDYRVERIEKQRQMLAEGGSLFVTSPRSFLMGKRSF